MAMTSTNRRDFRLGFGLIMLAIVAAFVVGMFH